MAQWYILQVYIAYTNISKACKLGGYYIKLTIQKEMDNFKKAQGFKCWSLIREIGTDGGFRAIVEFKPNKS